MSKMAGRDYRVDFVRGLALVFIFINHMPGNFFGDFTSRNFGFSDAAEIFVLLAGFSAAAAFYPRYAGGYPLATSVRVARRAGFLYTAHILTSVLAMAIACAASLYLHDAAELQSFNAYPIIKDPVAGFVGLATLMHQLSYFNILPLYIVLLLMLIIFMPLHKLDWRLLFATSILLWVTVSLFRLNLPSFPTRQTWFFNPLAWQLLFTCGFIWGVRVRAGLAIPYVPAVFWAAVAYLVFSLIWKFTPALWPYFPETDAFGTLWGFDKTYLSPIRLLHILALAYVACYTPVIQWMRHIPPSNALVQIGQHALPIFCTGSLLSGSLWLLRENVGGSLLFDFLCVAFGISVQVALAWFLAWQSNTPAGQIGSQAAGGFMAAPPPPTPPPAPIISDPAPVVQLYEPMRN